MSETRFFRCSHCGNIIGLIHDSGVPVVCCGEPMKELIPNTVEASQEKHLPVASVSDDAVTVKIGYVKLSIVLSCTDIVTHVNSPKLSTVKFVSIHINLTGSAACSGVLSV